MTGRTIAEENGRTMKNNGKILQKLHSLYSFWYELEQRVDGFLILVESSLVVMVISG